MNRLRLFVSCRPAVRTGRAGASTRCSTQGTRRAPARPPSDTEHRGGEVARRAICDGPMLGSATQRRRVGADPISFWGTFRCKRPNSTLAASSGFDQPLMIVLASSRILELGARSWKDCRPTGGYLVTRTETRNAGDHAGSPLHLHDCPRALLRCAVTAPVRG